MPCSTHPAKSWLNDTDLDTVAGYREPKRSAAQTITFAVSESQCHVIDPTNPRGTLDDGVEDRLNVSRRATDDAEHFSWSRSAAPGPRAILRCAPGVL